MEKNQVTTEELAIMIKKGFDGVTVELGELKHDMTEMKQGQGDIKLRLDNVAYRSAWPH